MAQSNPLFSILNLLSSLFLAAIFSCLHKKLIDRPSTF
jgi:hypothetical protein